MADGTQITISAERQDDSTRHPGPSKLSIPSGTTTLRPLDRLVFRSRGTCLSLSGATQALDVRTIIVSGMELFDLSVETGRKLVYASRRGIRRLHRSIADGRYTSTIRLDRNGNPFSTSSRLKWVVGYVDNNTHVMMQLDKDALYRLDVVGGASQQVRNSTPHPYQCSLRPSQRSGIGRTADSSIPASTGRTGNNSIRGLEHRTVWRAVGARCLMDDSAFSYRETKKCSSRTS